MYHILLFSCSISPLFNKIPLALLFSCACNSMIYSFWLLGIYVLLVLLKLLILNMFRICLLGVYVLSFLSQFLYLNMFCICLLDNLFVFLLLSACVSVVICLCFFDILLLIRRPAYNVYYGRRTVRTTVVIQCVLRLSYTLQKRTLYSLLAHNS